MVQSVTPAQARELMLLGDVDVVDVREDREWQGGHLPGARHVPLERLRAAPDASLRRDGVMFVCAAGVRSQTAARLAEARGLKKIYNLSGGTRGWANAGLPLIQDATAPHETAA